MRKEKIYALYKGDEFVDMGTRKYLANKLNSRVEFISYLASPTYKKRRAKENSKSMIVIKVDEIDD